MHARLFTIDQHPDSLTPGDSWSIWTEPPRLTRTGQLRRRSDGDPYTPAWRAGEEVICYYPTTGRCQAALEIAGPPEFRADEELWWTETTVVAFAERGPMLGEIGVAHAVQGGRQRLTPGQHGAARKRLP
jgi:hypothetical protein